MNTPFENLDPDARSEWREQPATRAYLATLADSKSRLVDGICYLAQSGAVSLISVAQAGGELKGMDFCLSLATREPTVVVPRG